MREMKAEYRGGLHSSFTEARKTISASLSCPPDLPGMASALRTLAAAIVCRSLPTYAILFFVEIPDKNEAQHKNRHCQPAHRLFVLSGL